MKQIMKQLVLLLGLSASITAAHAAGDGLAEVHELGRLNGLALACAQGDNISQIKAIMIAHAPKSRQHGATFEQATHESFLLRSGEQGACGDAPVIALQVSDQAARLRALFPVAEKP